MLRVSKKIQPVWQERLQAPCSVSTHEHSLQPAMSTIPQGHHPLHSMKGSPEAVTVFGNPASWHSLPLSVSALADSVSLWSSSLGSRHMSVYVSCPTAVTHSASVLIPFILRVHICTGVNVLVLVCMSRPEYNLACLLTWAPSVRFHYFIWRQSLQDMKLTKF